jgi:piezo-type mechanosensitive ion channel component 1/2
MLFRFSYKVILVVVFLLGSAKPSFLSLGYVVFSLFFLYRGDYLIKKKNRAWRWPRIWNFMILLLQSIYQASFVPQSEGKQRSLDLDLFLRGIFL